MGMLAMCVPNPLSALLFVRSKASTMTPTPTSRNGRSRLQEMVTQATHLKIKDMVNRGILSINEPIYKSKKVITEPTFTPRMDVYDNPDSPNLTATFEIPGVRNSDMNLSIKEGHLVIQGERRNPMYHCGAAGPALQSMTSNSDAMQVDSVQKIRVAVRELRHGRFFRRVPLPSGVEQSDIQASMFEGMLTVSWPRTKSTAAPDTAKPASLTALIDNAA